jgi:hypothetical protein
MQKQIRLPHSISTHLLPLLLVFPIFIRNSPIGNGVYDMNTLFAHLACERLGQLSDTRSAGAIGCELGVAAKGAEGAGKDDSLLLV